MAGEERLGEQLVHEVGRLVLVHEDLFEDDLALGLDLVGPEGRRPHDVGEDVEAELEVLVEQAGVEGRVLLGGEGVHVAADRVDRLGDLAGAAGLGALEQQVLEEVRGPGHSAGVSSREPASTQKPSGHRVRVGHALGDDPEAAVEAGRTGSSAYLRPPPPPPPPLRRRSRSRLRRGPPPSPPPPAPAATSAGPRSPNFALASASNASSKETNSAARRRRRPALADDGGAARAGRTRSARSDAAAAAGRRRPRRPPPPSGAVVAVLADGRQRDLALGVDVVDPHLDLVAQVDHVLDPVDALAPAELGDVDQAVAAGEDVDEGTELGDVDDLAGVDVADLGRGRVEDQLDPASGLGDGGAVLRADGDGADHAVVVDVDVGAGLLLDGVDDLALGPDDLADLVDRDLEADDLRRRLARPRRGARRWRRS